jgi:uncharacterized protein YeaO (DUF488 family)
MTFQIKRVYEPAKPSDGIRVLVDRLWPRGVKKATAHLDYWMKDVAPSPRLRLWFGHRRERFAEFGKRYKKELNGNAELAELRKLGRGALITLLYGARDPPSAREKPRRRAFHKPALRRPTSADADHDLPEMGT